VQKVFKSIPHTWMNVKASVSLAFSIEGPLLLQVLPCETQEVIQQRWGEHRLHTTHRWGTNQCTKGKPRSAVQPPPQGASDGFDREDSFEAEEVPQMDNGGCKGRTLYSRLR